MKRMKERLQESQREQEEVQGKYDKFIREQEEQRRRS